MFTTNALTYCVVSDGFLGYRGLYILINEYMSETMRAQLYHASILHDQCMSQSVCWPMIRSVDRLSFNGCASQLTHLPLEKNDHHYTDYILRCISMNEKFCILIKISLKFVPTGPIDNSPALVQIMFWCWIGDKPLSEPMLTHFNDAYMRH